MGYWCVFFFSSRRRHTRCYRDWSSDVCSSDLLRGVEAAAETPLPGGDVEPDEGVAVLEVGLPAWLHLSPRLPRHLARPRPGHDEQRAVPPAPGEGEAARPQADLHVLPGRAVL